MLFDRLTWRGYRVLNPLVVFKFLLAKIALIDQFCDRCGRSGTPVWWAKDEVWREVSGMGEGGVLCIRCFDALAWKSGILLMWRPEIEARKGE